MKEHEGLTKLGETGFLQQMFEESLKFKKNIAVFTSLVGKKGDFQEIRAFIEEKKKTIPELLSMHIYWTTIYQGKNARWIVGWSFGDKNLEEKAA